MAIVASNVLLPSIRTLACATLFRVLRLSNLLDRGWPGLGSAFRRAVLFLWWNVTSRLGSRLRARLRGDPMPGAPETRERPEPDPATIRLTPSDTPLVSVIIPTYGQLGFTLRCLASIQAHPPAAPIEVIVVDDAYPGRELANLGRVDGIRLVRNDVNLGFIRACNAAARAARGDFLHFLNNDTEVLPGWLDRMVEVFATRPDAGIVGSKLLGEDGKLREAGGILWNDGSAWNFGQGRDPDAPEFNYLRETDYCSGASLLVRRGIFLGVGGFDEKYAPAYCEDSDLSFRLRRIGLKTYYQPRSAIVHVEGASHGRDLRRGVKAFQVRNQATFLETWHEVLSRDHFLNGTHVLRARDRARPRTPGGSRAGTRWGVRAGAQGGHQGGSREGSQGRQVVLIVDHYVPEPDRDAGSRTMVAFIQALLAVGAVVKFWPFNLYRSPGYTGALQDMGVEVQYGPHEVSLAEWLTANGADIDLVLLSRPDVAEICLPIVRAGTQARIAYYGHDLHFQRLLTPAGGGAPQRREADAMRAMETGVWRDADIVLYPSDEEAAVVRQMAPSVTVRSVIPYAFAGPEWIADPAGGAAPDGGPDGMSVARTQPISRMEPGREPGAEPDRGEPSILFVAGFGHPPNAEAAVWFAREVMPLIEAHVPTARLTIVGSKPPACVSELCGPRVSLFANVTDAELVGWYRRARVAVVPLLSGAGVKLKTVEALWYGVPAVLTPAGAQGLPGIERVASVATDPASFAAAVRDLLTDDALWRQRRAAGMEYARARFSAPVQRRSLLKALDFVGSRHDEAAEGCAISTEMA
jgi:O-antigen biosynthesis protein